MKERVVVLTGAGVSAESGISTFRDVNGLWKSRRIEEVASPDGYRHTPDLVHDFYDARRTQALTAQPNDAHLALAWLESAHNDNVMIITQNVDDLHERAGSKNVIHMHGKLEDERIVDALNRCDLFVAIGTSGVVHPAASFAATARSHGAHTILLNAEAHYNPDAFDWVNLGKASEIVPDWVEAFLADQL